MFSVLVCSPCVWCIRIPGLDLDEELFTARVGNIVSVCTEEYNLNTSVCRNRLTCTVRQADVVILTCCCTVILVTRLLLTSSHRPGNWTDRPGSTIEVVDQKVRTCCSGRGNADTTPSGFVTLLVSVTYVLNVAWVGLLVTISRSLSLAVTLAALVSRTQSLPPVVPELHVEMSPGPYSHRLMLYNIGNGAL